MKRGFLVLIIVVVFLSFISTSFGGPGEEWKQCTLSIDTTSVNVGGITSNCCCYQGNCNWQLSQCCIDNDNDGYASLICGAIVCS